MTINNNCFGKHSIHCTHYRRGSGPRSCESRLLAQQLTRLLAMVTLAMAFGKNEMSYVLEEGVTCASGAVQKLLSS